MPVPRFAVGVAVPAEEVQGNETHRTCGVYGRAEGQASRRWLDVGRALCASLPLKRLRRFDQPHACRIPRRRAGFDCGDVLLPYLLKGIVINRDSTRRTSSTFLEQHVVKAVRAVPRQ